MANAALGAPGAVNSTGERIALYLKVFAGEVLSAFDERNVMKGLHTMRTISSGKSAQFIISGAASSHYHTPGENLLLDTNTTRALGDEAVSSETSYLSKIPHNERVIHIDKLLVSSAFIDDLDAAMSQWDIRGTYAKEIGRELARQFDINTLNVVIGASRADASVTGGKTGGSAGGSGADTDVDTLLDAIASAAQKLDENDVSESDRYLVIRPAQYWLLINDVGGGGGTHRAHMVNRDFTAGNGDIAKGTILQAYGFDIFKSNHVPAVTTASGDEEGRKEPNVGTTGNEPFDADLNGTPDITNDGGYHGTTTNTLGCAFHKSAIGSVKLLDLSVQSDYLVTHQGSLLVARYSMGHGILRPEAAVEITKA